MQAGLRSPPTPTPGPSSSRYTRPSPAHQLSFYTAEQAYHDRIPQSARPPLPDYLRAPFEYNHASQREYDTLFPNNETPDRTNSLPSLSPDRQDEVGWTGIVSPMEDRAQRPYTAHGHVSRLPVSSPERLSDSSEASELGREGLTTWLDAEGRNDEWVEILCPNGWPPLL